MRRNPISRRARWIAAILLLATFPLSAGYKVRPWKPRAIESYPSTLVSEGVTIAVEPLLTDALAAAVFDKKDIVTSGIMPLAVIIFNSNSYPVEVEAASIELQSDGNTTKTLAPDRAVQRMIKDPPKVVSIPVPGRPRIRVEKNKPDLIQDFQRKWLGIQKIAPKATGGGLVYFPVNNGVQLRSTLPDAKVYIPNVFRADTGANLIFFEIDLKAAVAAVPSK